MTPSWTLKTGVTDGAISSGDLKKFCRVTQNLEDDLFLLWFNAARGYIERVTQRGLLPQTWQLSLSELPTVLCLPYAAPLSSITHVKYYDADNALQTWASSNYITPAFHEPATIEALSTATWPSVYCRSDAWQVEYVVGYASLGAIPAPLQLALRMLVAHWNENREAALVSAISKEVEFSVTSLITPFRVWWVPPC
jgi:uncharacterized phiE125 gp8 family phage protein